MKNFILFISLILFLTNCKDRLPDELNTNPYDVDAIFEPVAKFSDIIIKDSITSNGTLGSVYLDIGIEALSKFYNDQNFSKPKGNFYPYFYLNNKSVFYKIKKNGRVNFLISKDNKTKTIELKMVITVDGKPVGMDIKDVYIL